MLLDSMTISSNDLVTSLSSSSWDENTPIVMTTPKTRLLFLLGQIPMVNDLVELLLK